MYMMSMIYNFISAHVRFKKSTRFNTCGSKADIFITVWPCLKTFATIKFSVAVTQNQALIILSQESRLQFISMWLSTNETLYHNACNQSRCESIGLFHILHQPGNGIDMMQSI